MRALRRALPGEEASGRALGLDGKRPLRPFRLSVLTTAEEKMKRVTLFSSDLLNGTKNNGLRSFLALSVYLLWPFPLWGTSGNDNIGIGSFCVCPQGSFWQPSTHTWHFFALYAAQREEESAYYSIYILKNTILHFNRFMALGLRCGRIYISLLPDPANTPDG